MNTQSNVATGSAVVRHAVAPVVIPYGRRMYWLVRRELWENRWLYWTPLVVAGLFLLGVIINLLRMRFTFGAFMGHSQQSVAILQPYDFIAVALMGPMVVIQVIYCLEALYGERRDRSILFWKSLPISDVDTVLSKAVIPLFVLPVITFAVTVVTQCVMVLVQSVFILARGQSLAMLWGHLPLLHMSIGLLFHLVAIHGLWYAPFFGWLLLVSAWSKRAPFLWAALPVVVIGGLEKIAFNTSKFWALLVERLGGGPEGAAYLSAGDKMNGMNHLHPEYFLLSPGLWAGLLITALCLFAAVRLRRSRGPL